MIQHIFKIIWNERKVNSWILIEFTFVFCILWFCCDYLYYMGRVYLEPSGFDIENTYHLGFVRSENDTTRQLSSYDITMLILERLERHPEIEKATISSSAMPYGNMINMNMAMTLPDSIQVSIKHIVVSPDFFEVFRIPLQYGRIADPTIRPSEVMISPDWRNGFGSQENDKPYPPEKIAAINFYDHDIQDMVSHTLTGITPKLKSKFNEPFLANFIEVKPRGEITGLRELVVRTKHKMDKGFEERFLEEMREQLSVGPNIFTSITSLKDIQQNSIKYSGISDRLNSVYAISAFLIINIFLGIIGTFWYRIQSRQGEIGLRIALGSSRKKVRRMLFTETLLLLFTGSFIGMNICLQLAQTDLLVTLGLPMADHIHTNSGTEQYLINYLITFFFLAVVSLLAVWYPARKASVIQPAEALRSE